MANNTINITCSDPMHARDIAEAITERDQRDRWPFKYDIVFSETPKPKRHRRIPEENYDESIT